MESSPVFFFMSFFGNVQELVEGGEVDELRR